MACDDHKSLQTRARLAGFLFLAVNAAYIASLLAFAAGPEELRRPAVALMACASAATIAMAWAFYELLKPAGQSLALLALLFRVAEAALFGVVAMFALRLLGGEAAGGASGPSGLGGLGGAVMPALLTSGAVGQVYFCGGSAIFFYLLLKGRFVPRAIAAVGLIATFLSLAGALVQIGAPALAGYLAFNGPLLLAAETATGVWLLVVGAGRGRVRLAEADAAAA